MQKYVFILLTFFFMVQNLSFAQCIPKEPVQIISVIDGDTVKAIYKGSQESIRLEGIDAPELSQGIWGQTAKTYLENLLKNKLITVQVTGRDKYLRLLGYLYANNTDINESMVTNGYSYAYLKYSYEFENDEKLAKSYCLGFWCKKNQPVYPWIYRNKSFN